MSANLPNSAPSSEATFISRLRNILIALVAIVLSSALFFGLQTSSGESSLAALAATSTPLETAQTNEKPTLLEFYADWCTSCQAMAKDMGELREEYGDRINFVMLNVDNNKWLPEVLKYRVDGIPLFVFMDSGSNDLVSVIGEQPRSIMAANLAALADGSSLPYAVAAGQTSKVQAPVAPTPSVDDPRSHGTLPAQG